MANHLLSASAEAWLLSLYLGAQWPIYASYLFSPSNRSVRHILMTQSARTNGIRALVV